MIIWTGCPPHDGKREPLADGNVAPRGNNTTRTVCTAAAAASVGTGRTVGCQLAMPSILYFSSSSPFVLLFCVCCNGPSDTGLKPSKAAGLLKRRFLIEKAKAMY